MGISFYAFSGVSYLVDVYRRVIPPEPNFWRYALFSTFFPHLVAGPILRAREFLWHLGPGALPSRPAGALEATFLIGRGLFKKIVLADSIAAAIDPFFAHVLSPATEGVWSLPYVYLYALQIYFDFSGYTDIGRGLGLWFGFRWPENFDWPYLATSVQEFWRRWHMTLSRFLRDYLYIPLGGSRNGLACALFATMGTMLLGGLWHGASGSFLIWGGLHGLFLMAHRLWTLTSLRQTLSALTGFPKILWITCAGVLTFHAVSFAWCFFRLSKLPEAIECLQKTVSFDSQKMWVGGASDARVWLMVSAYGLATALGVRFSRGATLQNFGEKMSTGGFRQGLSWGFSVGLILAALALARKEKAVPFIYFQF
jgi:alginate O-acetyltransferase complex protein AlgI